MGAGVLALVGAEAQFVTGTKDRQLTAVDGRPVDIAATGEHVEQGVEVRPPGQAHLRALAHRDVRHGDRGRGDARSRNAADLAGDHPDQGTGVGRCSQPNLAGAQVLVPRWGHLECLGEVDPQLNAVEQPAGRDEVLRWPLDVQ